MLEHWGPAIRLACVLWRRKWKSSGKHSVGEWGGGGQDKDKAGQPRTMWHWHWVLSKGRKMWMGGSGCSLSVGVWFCLVFLILEVSPVGVPLPAWSLLLTPCALAVTSGSSSQTVAYRYWSSPGQPFTDGSPSFRSPFARAGWPCTMRACLL